MDAIIAKRLLTEINNRLEFLDEVGAWLSDSRQIVFVVVVGRKLRE